MEPVKLKPDNPAMIQLAARFNKEGWIELYDIHTWKVVDGIRTVEFKSKEPGSGQVEEMVIRLFVFDGRNKS